MVGAAYRVRKLLQVARPQILHANGLKATLVCQLAVLGTGIPLVWVKHDFSWDGWMARAAALRCASVIGVSKAVTGTFSARSRQGSRYLQRGRFA